MKKIINVLLTVTLLSGCYKDINNVRPTDSFEVSEFYSTVEDFEASLGGAFQQLQNYYAYELLVMGDIPTENLIQVESGRTSNDVYWDWRYTSLNNIGMLDEGYEAVNIANNIIANIEVLPKGVNRNDIMGQAMIIRALAHCDMAKVYGQLPTQSSGANASLGVFYKKFEDGNTGDPFLQPERESIKSNYDNIIKDLIAAKELINPSSTDVENHFTVEAVDALLSRIYLYRGEWQKTIDATNLVTTKISASSKILDVFRDLSNDGIIMKLAIDFGAGDDLDPGIVWGQTSTSTTVAEYAMSYDLFTSISDNDVRKTVFAITTTNQGNEYNSIRKWLGEGDQVNGVTDMPVLRAAEVVLNKAEAQFELGNEAEALTTLDILRDKRYTTYTGGETGASLKEAIRFERRVEFFCEYQRFFDVKRWGLEINRSATFGDIADGTGTIAEKSILKIGSKEFLLPIPQSEIDANPNFVQNPGYESN